MDVLVGVFVVCGAFVLLVFDYSVLIGFYGKVSGWAERQAVRHGEDVNPPSRAWHH